MHYLNLHETFTMKLTHSDIIVKRTMLEHPLISKSRLSVLSQILLREPDAHWGADGRVHVYGVKETNPRKAVMKMPAHLSQPIEIDEELHKLMPDYYEARLVERELEVMQYAFIEKNIDCFAKRNLSHQAKFDVKVLTANASNPLIFNVPDNVESSWKKAALEVMDAAIQALLENEFIARSLNGEKNDPLKAIHWKMGYWASMYEKFYNAREKLSPTKVNPEAKAELSALWESVVNPEQ